MEDLGVDIKYLEPSRVRQIDEVSGSYTYFSDGDVLLAKITPCFENGKVGIARGLTNGIGFGSSEYVVLRPSASLSAEFLYYFLARSVFREEGSRTMTGAVGHKRITKEFVENSRIPLPPIFEQQRIVAILDEAFEGIATNKANAEKSLQRIGDLFSSHSRRIFSDARMRWPGRTLDSVATNLDSKRIPITKADRKAGEYPYYGASGIVDYVADYIFDGNALLISEDGANLLARSTPIAFSVSGRYWVNNHAHILQFEHMETQRFVEFFLESIPLDGYITGAAQPKLNQKALNSISIPLPETLGQQREVVDRLSALTEKTMELRKTYEKKLAALDELKNSLLHQAFSGQLTPSRRINVVQQSTPQTTTAEFSANVISLAHARHERQSRERTFGHVKEQKVLHLIESISGVDLGRHPMRDAAGPNDFQHMLNAEKWAKAQGFFDMVKNGEGYEFRKLSKFDEHMSRAREALAPYLSRIEPVIDLLVPMDKEEAEVFATVHAAWSNLVIDGLPTTDDAIVAAARDDWHPDKLKLPEHMFRSAIAKIRQKNLIPDGKAKYVGGQKSLL